MVPSSSHGLSSLASKADLPFPLCTAVCALGSLTLTSSPLPHSYSPASSVSQESRLACLSHPWCPLALQPLISWPPETPEEPSLLSLLSYNLFPTLSDLHHSRPHQPSPLIPSVNPPLVLPVLYKQIPFSSCGLLVHHSFPRLLSTSSKLAAPDSAHAIGALLSCSNFVSNSLA